MRPPNDVRTANMKSVFVHLTRESYTYRICKYAIFVRYLRVDKVALYIFFFYPIVPTWIYYDDDAFWSQVDNDKSRSMRIIKSVPFLFRQHLTIIVTRERDSFDQIIRNFDRCFNFLSLRFQYTRTRDNHTLFQLVENVITRIGARHCRRHFDNWFPWISPIASKIQRTLYVYALVIPA